MNKAVKGDFIGFTYGGVHFSGHGLMRVSDGSRYSTYLLPSINNKSVQIPGKDGSYFFNSNFGNMEFSISVAYDSITETDMRKIKQLLGDKKPHALWFDENPYKEYIAKVSKPPQFKWICFDESKNIYRDINGVNQEEMTRLYKGEGVINFTCHTPYARSRINFLDDQVDSVLWGYGSGSGRDYILTQVNARDDGQIFSKWYLKNYPLTEDQVNYFGQISKTTEELDKKFNEREYSYFRYRSTRYWPIDKDKYEEDETRYIGGTFKKIRSSTDYEIIGNAGHDGISTSTASPNTLAFSNKIPVYIETDVNNIPIAYWDDKGRVSKQEDNWNSNLNGPILGYRKISYNQSPYGIFLTPLTLEFNYNFKEWKTASGLRYKKINENSEYNTFITEQKEEGNQKIIKTRAFLYNAGDIEANLKIYCTIPEQKGKREFKNTIFKLYSAEIGNTELQGKELKFFELDDFNLKEGDNGILIDSKLKLVLGTKDGQLTGNYYNKYHIGGDFLKLPPTGENEYLILTSGLDVNEFPMEVEYRHIYY